MKRFIIPRETYLETLREHRRYGSPAYLHTFFVNRGVWYQFKDLTEVGALFEECAESEVPPERIAVARRYYPGALNRETPS